MRRTPARHSTLPHTADAGIEAIAEDLEALFEEAATALIELTASISAGTVAARWESIRLEASDVTSLAYRWLNEVISLGDIGPDVVVAVRLERLLRPLVDDPGGAWGLVGQVGLRREDGDSVRVLRQPKSATYHGLSIEQRPGGWTFRAYLDL